MVETGQRDQSRSWAQDANIEPSEQDYGIVKRGR